MSIVKFPDAGGDTITLMEVDGHLYHKAAVDLIRGIRDVTIRDDDILVCAYPKCGTHWIWEISRLLLAGSTELDVKEKHELMLEFSRNAVLEKAPSPRILNVHCLVDQLPRGVFEKKNKIIYILRNPKDMAVSFYHHHIKTPFLYEYNGSWKNYLPLILDGTVDSGSWFTYTKDWAKIGQTHPDIPVLTLMYEDLKEDPMSGIRKIAKFLGADNSEAFYEKVRDLTNFDKMKAAKGHFFTASDGSSVMYRKGEVGDWKNYFTVAQNEMFDKVYKEKMKGCDIHFRYTL